MRKGIGDYLKDYEDGAMITIGDVGNAFSTKRRS